MSNLKALILLGLVRSAFGLPSQTPYSAPPQALTYNAKQDIQTWALNPSGDAAVIRVRTITDERPQDELHLLAINAQFTVPSVNYGPADPSSLYTFLDDQTFLTIHASLEDDLWEIKTQILNYTTAPPAFPPSASQPRKIGMIKTDTKIEELIYSRQAGKLTLLSESKTLSILEVNKQNGVWLVEGGLRSIGDPHDVIREVATNGTHLVYSAIHTAGKGRERSLVFLVDLRDTTFTPQIISRSKGASLTAPAFGSDGYIAWLSRSGNENKRLWLSNGSNKWQAELDSVYSPESIIFSKDGKAIYLLTPHGAEQSLFHIWTPSSPSSDPIVPIRIPSNGTIHSAIHVGITPLDHAHLIGVKSDKARNEGKELWVISHSPHGDPTYNYENIRLTHFT